MAALWQSIKDIHIRGTLLLAPDTNRADQGRFAAPISGQIASDMAAITALEPDLGGLHKRGLFFIAEAHLNPRQAQCDLVAVLLPLACMSRWRM